jgi:hypothetical protein
VDELILMTVEAMQKIKQHITVFIFLFTMVFFMQSCASLKKNGCGCPNKKGMVGY